MLGSGVESAGAAFTNGTGLQWHLDRQTEPRRVARLGIDTEEGGFDPTSARWDEGGFLYGRTVFDPLAVVTAHGKVEPYLAQSITPMRTSPAGPSPCGRGSCSTTGRRSMPTRCS